MKESLTIPLAQTRAQGSASMGLRRKIASFLALFTAAHSFSGCVGGGDSSVLDAFLGVTPVNDDNSFSLNYSGTNFVESTLGNGTLSTTLTLTFLASSTTAGSLAGSIGQDFVASGLASVTNIPAGLSAVITKTATDKLTFTFTGSATSHSFANSVYNLTVAFNSAAFTGVSAAGVVNSTKNDLSITFRDAAAIAYSSSTFYESGTNNGSILNTLTLTLTNDTFAGTSGEDYLASGKAFVSNVPAGLTMTVTRDSDSQVTLALLGTAAAHTNTNDVANLTLTFDSSAFTVATVASSVVNYTKNNIVVDFNEGTTIGYSGTVLTESEPNNGAFTETLTLSLFGDIFTGSNGDDFVAGGKASVANLPAGLGATLTRTSSSTAVLALTGNASAHTTVDNIANLTLNLLNGAFISGSAAGVSGASRSDLSIQYRNPHSLSYSTSTFTEGGADNGTIGNTILITLTGTTFTGADGSNLISAGKVTVTNASAGLTPVITKVSSTSLLFSMSGTATSNYNANDVVNLTVVFADSAFTSGNANLITLYSRNNLVIDYFSSTVAAPSDVTVTNSTATTATVGWTDNAANETEYEVERCNGTSCATTFVAAQTVAGIAANTTSYVFTGLTEGQQYVFRVRAKHPESSSPWGTTPLSVVFGGIQQNDPGNGTLSEFKQIDCRTQEGAYVILKWNAIASASSYLVYDASSGSDSLIATVSGSSNYYVVQNLNFSTSYSYKVKVIMSGTGVTSTNSTNTNVTTDANFAACVTFPGKTLKGGATLPTQVNNPENLWVHNNRLYVVDTANHRVLIWNTIPTSGTTPPDRVLGNERVFASNGTTLLGITAGQNYRGTLSASVNASGLNSPKGIWVGDVGGTLRIIVADSGNNRVLIWNGFPTQDFEAASLVVGQPNFVSATSDNGGRVRGMQAPNGVASDGTRLVIADTSNHRILIFNTFPTTDYATPDAYLAATSTTAESAACAAGRVNNPRGLWIQGTKLLVADSSNNRVLIWNNFTGLNGATTMAADVVIGGGANPNEFTSCTNAATSTRLRNPYALWYDSVGDQLYVGDRDNHRVQVFSGIPTTLNPAASHALGTSNAAGTAGTTAGATRNSTQAIVARDVNGTTDDYVIVADAQNHRIKVHTSIPSANNTAADFYIGKEAATTVNNTNYLGPTQNSLYTAEDIEVYGGQMFVADQSHHRVLVWNTIPKNHSVPPDYVIGQANFTAVAAGNSATGLNSPAGLCAGNNKLFVTENSGHRVAIFNLPITGSTPSKVAVLGQTTYAGAGSDAAGASKGRFENPRDCYYDEGNDRLAVADQSNHRVLYWPTFMASFTAASGGPMDGGAEDARQLAAAYYVGTNNTSGTTQSRLNNPTGVALDGSYLWVADATNLRAVRFDIPTADGDPANLVIGQADFVTATNNTTSQGLVRSAAKILVANSGRVYLTDPTSNRVMIWENPSSEGEPATGVIGQASFATSNKLNGGARVPMDAPRGLATDGKRLFVTNQGFDRVLIFPLFDE